MSEAHTEAEVQTPNLIVNGQLQVNPLRRFEVGAEVDTEAAARAALPPDEPDWLIPVSIWLAHDVRQWRQRQHPVALLLGPEVDLAVLFAHSPLADLQAAVSLMAIDFPAYTDGRGYSLAQLLRQPYGWTGELRAVGDVMIDTMHYLARCGFDSFLVKPGHNPQQALTALATFTRQYQRAYRASSDVARLATGGVGQLHNPHRFAAVQVRGA